MFAGHYAAAFAAKTLEPRAPFWTYAGACQLVDIAWSGLVMGGVEKMPGVDHAPAGAARWTSGFMPYTHSLPRRGGLRSIGVTAALAPAHCGLRTGARRCLSSG